MESIFISIAVILFLNRCFEDYFEFGKKIKMCYIISNLFISAVFSFIGYIVYQLIS